MARQDLTGKTFNRLTVLEFAYPKNGNMYWWCECACPAKTRLAVRANCLKDGNTKSCGCYKIDVATKHGHNAVARDGGPTPTYISWMGMRDRCGNPASEHYRAYGGAGIRVAERWHDFRAFLADMGERPPGCTLDRFPNQQGNYEPDNCRWATPRQQAQNRRNNRMLTFEGRTQSLSAWAEERGMPLQLLQDRYRKRNKGWDARRILTAPRKAWARRS